jgi:hypothetical protein
MAQRMKALHARKEATTDSLRALNRELRAIELESEAATWRAFMVIAQARLSPELFDELLTDARKPGAITRIHRHGRPRIPVGSTTPHLEHQ